MTCSIHSLHYKTCVVSAIGRSPLSGGGYAWGESSSVGEWEGVGGKGGKNKIFKIFVTLQTKPNQTKHQTKPNSKPTKPNQTRMVVCRLLYVWGGYVYSMMR